MLTSLVGLCLVAAPLKVASAGLSGVGVDEKLLTALGEKVAQQLAEAPNVSVITKQDVAALLGLERQKQLLGCAEEASACVTELAGALGAALVLSGDIAKVGARYTATLKLLDARTGRAVYSGAGDAASEDELLELMKTLATAARVTLSPSQPVRWLPAVPLAAGLALSVAGAVLLVNAKQNVTRIAELCPRGCSDASAAAASGARLRDQGKLLASLGVGLLGVGGAALLAGAVWWLWPASPHVALVPTGNGGAIAFGGAW